MEFCKSPFLAPQGSPVLACQKKDDDCIIAVKCPAPVNAEAEATTPVVNFELPPTGGNKAKAMKAEYMVDVEFSGVEVQASKKLQGLLQSVKELWKEQTVTFGGDCEEFLSKHKDLKMTILAQGDSLVGFIMYRLHPKKNVAAHMSISRLAIAPEFRRQGYAGQFMKWGMRQPGVSFLAVTSLPKALDFYKAFGFRKVETWHTGGTAQPDEEPELGSNQVYLEFNPSKNNGKKQKGRK